MLPYIYPLHPLAANHDYLHPLFTPLIIQRKTKDDRRMIEGWSKDHRRMVGRTLAKHRVNIGTTTGEHRVCTGTTPELGWIYQELSMTLAMASSKPSCDLVEA